MIEIDCATIRKIADDIIILENKDTFEIELADAIQINAAYERLSNGREVYSIMNTAQSFNSFSKEAQEYLARTAPFVQSNLLAASAIVVTNLPNRLLAKFFINFYKPAYPIKITSDVKEAEAWLKELKQKKSGLRV